MKSTATENLFFIQQQLSMATLLSIKHDKIIRELSTENYDSKFLWKQGNYSPEINRNGLFVNNF